MVDFANALKAHASALDQARGQPRIAIVASVDPTAGLAKVLLQPEGTLSGWLPWTSIWVGAGWGLACPPSPGDQVLVLPQEGDSEAGLIVGRLWSQAQQCPPAPAGELWVVHQSGSCLKLLNDGSVTGTASIWHLSGDVHIVGDIYDSHGALSTLRSHYNEHTHVDSRGGTTSTPQPTD